MDHEAITRVVTKNHTVEYGKGILPNPFSHLCDEWQRRHEQSEIRKAITQKIESLYEPRFITPPETSECIEAIVTMTDSRRILELGTCTGFSALHILRAIIGKPNAKLTCVECRPAHDREFFNSPFLKEYFEFIEESTPQALDRLHGQIFDLVFVDSDHSVAHCEKEFNALLPITRQGTIFLFHDCPEKQTPDATETGVVWRWLNEKVAQRALRGTAFPSCRQADCAAIWGPDYPKECSPGLGIFIRQ